MSKTNTRILIIEDDEKLANTIERRLYLEGIDHFVAPVKGRTFKEDLAKIEKILVEKTFDLVILDIVFDPSLTMSTPETNGLAVLKVIREYDKFVPVLVFTGFPNDIDQGALVREGANYLIIKGEDNAIMDAVTRFLKEHDEIIKELEAMVEGNPKADAPVLQKGDKRYSLKEMLTEMKKGTQEGNQLYKLYKTGLSEMLMRTKKE